MEPWKENLKLPDNYVQDFLKEYFSDTEIIGFKMLDFGAGYGYYLDAWSKVIGIENVYGTELDPDAIRVLKEKGYNCFQVEKNKAILPYNDNSFDLVFSRDVVEHVPRDIYLQYLKEINRVLKPCGKFIFSTPNYPIKRLYDYKRIITLKAKEHFKYYLFDDPTHINKMSIFMVEKDVKGFFSETVIKKQTIIRIGKFQVFKPSFLIHKTFAICEKKIVGFKGIDEIRDMSYSIRRFFVDDFFYRMSTYLKKDEVVIDIGGKKSSKRGRFNLSNYCDVIKYVNIDDSTNPDYCCNAEKIPVENNSVDTVIISETMEHLENPEKVLMEVNRILKKDGIVLICSPFIYHEHGDPEDYLRYTGNWYVTKLEVYGFKILKLRKQGLFFGVIANMIRLLVNEMHKKGRFKNKIVWKIVRVLIYEFSKLLVRLDRMNQVKNNKILSGYTTGYGVLARKKEDVF
jgi:ubiquinone/menaquinone biosynthesis C-methylase UbiE